MRTILLTALVLFSLSTASAQQYSKAIKEQIARVENGLSVGLVVDGKHYTLAERMKHYNVKGVSIAVIDDYKVIWSKAYGYADVQANLPMTTNTLVEPGSISKSLNAVGLLLLAQRGKLDLYQDINQYLSS